MFQEIDSYLLDFTNQYVKSTHMSDIVQMSRKFSEMDESQKRFEKLSQDLQRRVTDLSVKQSKLNRPPAAASAATSVLDLLVVTVIL